jgi:NAD-dependent dihydropyrimidine dehydrogenase PreA subunit
MRDFQKKRSGGFDMAYKPEVDGEKCAGCGECVEICPVEMYEPKDEKSVVVKEEECLGCESCVEVCEQKTITVSDV